ncbi:hypothetical protein [Streptomyces sp. NBC_01618]|uniref:hypothetical protein n=1 Tax=Streptomyces sp. NBC_01618 TaxID=2975900 RepID=UPI00386D26AD|nr:hypothetical protein OH735_08500 [Streptomyces sp. NBC_01618]
MYEPTTAEQLHTIAQAADTQPLSEAQAAAEAARLIAEGYSTNSPVATSYKDVAPLPTTGDAMPWPQPGRPPMSQKATDVSALMLAGGVASLPIGAATSLVLWSLGQVDPINLAIGAGAPVALVLAVAAVVRRLQGVNLHTENHHHYTGTVRQETTNVSTTTKGMFARTRNDIR